MAAACRPIATRSRNCRAWDARRRTSCSTAPSVSRRCPSTRTSSASRIALGLARGDTPRAGRGRPARGAFPREYLLQRASLAAAARPLRLQGTQARVPALPDRRPVRLQGQDVAAGDHRPLTRPGSVTAARDAADAVLPRPGPRRRCGACTSRPGASTASRCRSSRVEDQIIRVIALHPEYAQLLEVGPDGTRPRLHARGRPDESVPAHGAASRDPRAGRQRIDRPASPSSTARWPPGSATCTRPSTRMIERLGEALWQAQRAGLPPDEARYLESLRRLL